jgi:hypothetical protein
MKKLMYIEDKSCGLEGPGRIGWVEITRTGRSYKYKGKRYLRCAGYKYNCIEEETGNEFWISGPKKNGKDRLYMRGIVEIDDDANEEYWLRIRDMKDKVGKKSFRC